MSRPRDTWLKYGSRIKDDVRMKKLESVDSKGFIHYLDLILLVKNDEGALHISTNNWDDFCLLFNVPIEEGRKYLSLFKELNLIIIDEENFIVSIPENILSFVGNQDTSTERVRKCRANKKENESMLHEENLMFRENDNDIEKQQHLLQKTNETLHETNGTLHVLEETDETVDQIRVDKNRKDKIRSSEINTSMNCNKNMEVAQIWQS